MALEDWIDRTFPTTPAGRQRMVKLGASMVLRALDHAAKEGAEDDDRPREYVRDVASSIRRTTARAVYVPPRAGYNFADLARDEEYDHAMLYASYAADALSDLVVATNNRDDTDAVTALAALIRDVGYAMLPDGSQLRDAVAYGGNLARCRTKKGATVKRRGH